jgi:hypothetical protein
VTSHISLQVRQLVLDCERVEEGYSSEGAYRSHGGKFSTMTQMSHARQQSNYTSASVYEKRGKAAYKKSWL